MIKILLEDILRSVEEEFPAIQGKMISTSDIIYEERVKLSCFYCARYNVCWRCPPRIPDLDYPKIMGEFENAALVWVDLPFTKETYSDVRSESSVMLHKAILKMEKYLLANHADIYLSFIGGSCKLCKNGCGKERCNNPYLARIPLEATGINVVKTVAKYGIHVEFPATTHMMRIGMILW